MELGSKIRDSVLLLKRPRALTTCAVLIAMQVALAMLVTIPITQNIRVTLDRSVLALNASLLGPVVGAMAGAVSDLLQCLLHGWAPNPGLTLNEALVGFLYGAALYQLAASSRHTLARLLITQALITVAVNLLLGTLWLSIMYGLPFWANLPARALKNLLQFPIDVFVIYALLHTRDRLESKNILKRF